ncbi:MAG: flagellar motor protein MotA [Rhodospirillales bacterium]|nr:flagellar motor protein MotA [Rhodospirillales bacterium]
MNQPRRFLFRMGLFLAAVAVVIALLWAGLMQAFMANPALNGLILGVLLIGIILNFRQVLMLRPEVGWIDEVRHGKPVLSTDHPPRLLAPLATMLGERRDRFSLSAMAMRSVLDGISSRLDEAREISRYFIGLLIFLGLLGTFWGLVQTVGSIGDVIRSLSLAGEDFGTAFEGLKSGLEAPLGGMGTAFSSSLFGLAGSLVVGFLDLQAGQAQNAFYNDLEEWLSSQTRLASGGTLGEASDQPIPAYIQALLEQTADSLDNLQRIITRGEESRITSNASMRALTDKLSTLTDQMKAEQTLMIRLAESQLEMKPLIARLAESSSQGVDEATRGHIRNLDVTLSRALEDLAAGRDEVIREMRSEFKLLARTIAAIADETER